METVGTYFHHSGPSRKSGGGEGSSRKLWAFPHGTWCDPFSACIVNVQPCAGANDTDVSQIPTSLLFRGKQVPGRDRHTGSLSQPVWWALWWCRHRYVTSVCHKRFERRALALSVLCCETTKYRNLNVDVYMTGWWFPLWWTFAL